MPDRRTSPYSSAARPRRSSRSGCIVFILFIVIMAGGIFVILPGIWDTRSAEAYLPDPHEEYTGTALAPFFTPSVRYWGSQIEAWAAANDLDPNLAAAVMQIESCGDPLAKSRAGAAGLFQVMPFHFEPGEDAYEPEINALRGLNYLQTTLSAAGGDIRQALAAYNGGITLLGQPESAWPAESQRFAAWGAGIHAEAQSGSSASPSLDDWLKHGGIRLCWQAERRLGLP